VQKRKKNKEKKILKVKSGTGSKEKTLSALATYGIRNHIKAHRHQKSHPPVANMPLQQQHQQLPALQPGILLTLPAAAAATPPHYQYCSSSLLCRCARLHQKVENVPSLRPFQKKMSGLSQEKKRFEDILPPLPKDEPPNNPQQLEAQLG
jgi:hypothetical protein